MIRTFQTNRIRRTRELSGSLWDFSPCSGEHKNAITPVAVPCCWESVPGFSNYRGTGLFSRTMETQGNIRLVFKGVSHTAKVCLDGDTVAEHYNAYTPFSVVLKGVPSGSHLLEVYADNSFREESALHVPNDYMSYGGISRGVVLEELADAFVETIHAIPVKTEEGWTTKVTVKIKSLSGEEKVCGLNIEVNGRSVSMAGIILPPGETVCAETEIMPGEVEAWELGRPRLYEIRAVLSLEGQDMDDLIDRIGYRTVKTEGSGILLNGRKLRIKGFCRHEDHPMFGCAIPFFAMQQDLLIAKDLGANSIRTSHYPNDELFLDLCDEQGILVWEENHARGLTLEQMKNPNFEPQAENCIQEMIDAHINHPSVIIWGILNECASDTEYGYDCYKKQYELIRSLDDSRPRSSASCRFKTDICLGLPEIVSYNLYPEWYHDTPAGEYVRDIYQWVQTGSEGRGKPFLVTEIGAGAIYGYRAQTLCKWSEEYQARALEDQIRAVLDHEGISGIYIWQFCDIRVSDEWFATRPRTMNNKGIVDEYRRRKMSYDVVKRLFHSYEDHR
ncbi:glycoside hydrolase family 2 TIM barrel-domain containing protein [Lachnospiraceae bacterium 54-53]